MQWEILAILYIAVCSENSAHSPIDGFVYSNRENDVLNYGIFAAYHLFQTHPDGVFNWNMMTN